MQSLKFLTWPAVAGLLLALLILDRWVLPATGGLGSSGYEVVSYANAVRAATPAVVNIYTAKLVSSGPDGRTDSGLTRRFAQPGIPPQRQRIERSLGSGVIVTRAGHILTNNHVIAGADAIQVMLQDGRSANAVVIGTDTATDLAVLKVDLPDLQPITLGDSNAARVGDVVLAIGNPLGFGHSVTQGIVSALGRYGLQPNAYEDYIQTDAIIHLGNSGGALVDTRGRLLGINTLIYTGNSEGHNNATGIGISLAIPVNLAVFVMQDLIDYGEVIRGWLGVSVEPVGIRQADGKTGQALAVVEVATNGPAQRAGVMPGDLITHIDGEPVKDGRLTMHRIALLRPGDSVDIALLRGQQKMDLRAVVGAITQAGG
ncbi:MAG: trypsin-like peptidase domain-containing protein [Gammaproteobacteria bacterium]|nr:trypsin-like peptidase domain-containing protein [Gammaproteobacteria bacterium]